MDVILKDIRDKLQYELYKNEELVRFLIVTRLLGLFIKKYLESRRSLSETSSFRSRVFQ